MEMAKPSSHTKIMDTTAVLKDMRRKRKAKTMQTKRSILMTVKIRTDTLLDIVETAPAKIQSLLAGHEISPLKYSPCQTVFW